MGKIISAKEAASAQAKENEIAKNQDNPGGAGGIDNEDEKTEDVANAEKISFGNVATDAKTQNYYVL